MYGTRKVLIKQQTLIRTSEHKWSGQLFPLRAATNLIEDICPERMRFVVLDAQQKCNLRMAAAR